MEAKMITTKSSEVKISDVPNECICYSNTALVMVSNDDVMIHFGLRKVDDPNVGDGVAKVFLNLSHAKRLAIVLTRSIDNYEKTFGKIQDDPMKQLSPEQLKQMGIILTQEPLK